MMPSPGHSASRGVLVKIVKGMVLNHPLMAPPFTYVFVCVCVCVCVCLCVSCVPLERVMNLFHILFHRPSLTSIILPTSLISALSMPAPLEISITVFLNSASVLGKRYGCLYLVCERVFMHLCVCVCVCVTESIILLNPLSAGC